MSTNTVNIAKILFIESSWILEYYSYKVLLEF